MSASLVWLAALLAAGVLWRHTPALAGSFTAVRKRLSWLMIWVLAPALVWQVFARAPLGGLLVQVPAAAIGTILTCLVLGLALAWLLGRGLRLGAAERGALVLAAAFGNGLGMALPVLHAVYGGAQDNVVLLFDILGTVVVGWTVGLSVAAVHGHGRFTPAALLEFLRVPVIWTLLAAMAARWQDLALPAALQWLVDGLGAIAVPVLVLIVGMSLAPLDARRLRLAAAPLVIKMLIAPLVAWSLAGALALTGEPRTALALTAAAPPFMVGAAFCARYGLDAELYTASFTLGTVAYLLLGAAAHALG